jgi:peroxiredoxin
MRNLPRFALTTLALAGLLAGCGAEPEKAAAPKKAPATPTVPALPATPPAPAAPATPATPTVPVAPESPAPAPAAATNEVPEGSEVGQRIADYRNTVRRPGADAPVEFGTLTQKGLTVYIVNSTTCPYCTQYVDRMKEIEKTYMAKGVDVVHVYPVREQTEADKIAHHKKQGFQGGLVVDCDAEFAKALDIEKTPTAILTDAKGVILYRGRIDDNAKADRVKARELADAIDLTLAGKPVEVTTTEPFG